MYIYTKLGKHWEGRGVAIAAKPIGAHPKTIPKNDTIRKVCTRCRHCKTDRVPGCPFAMYQILSVTHIYIYMYIHLYQYTLPQNMVEKSSKLPSTPPSHDFGVSETQDPLAPELAEAAAETAQCLGTDAFLGKDDGWCGWGMVGVGEFPRKNGDITGQITMTSAGVTGKTCCPGQCPSHDDRFLSCGWHLKQQCLMHFKKYGVPPIATARIDW